jgi:WD40 repeat protein
MASGGFDKAVRLWSADEPSAQAVLQGHTAVVQAVAFSADGKRLASGGSDQSIRLWDVASHKQLAELTGHAATVEALVFTNKGVLVSGAADGALRFWNSEGRLLEERFVRDARIKSLGLSDDALWLAVGCSDGSTRVYSAPERLELARVAGHKNSVYGVAFSPDGKRLATASFDRTIAVWTISARHPT